LGGFFRLNGHFMLKQIALSRNVEPLQIPVPENFQGDRSSEEPQLMLTTQFHSFTLDEIGLIEQFLTTLPYVQTLAMGGVMLGDDDPLLTADHEFLDALETLESLPKTRFAKGGGENSIMARILLIRESGFIGSGKLALAE
jgi:hypothetical protein